MKTIVIVDDHATVLRVLRLGIEQAGYRVETSANGSEALSRLGRETPDFLVTDIDMPQMNGKELCLEIEKRFPDRKFPIVVLTSRTEMEHRDWTSHIDNLTFMEKPVSVRRLVAHIDRCVNRIEENAGA